MFFFFFRPERLDFKVVFSDVSTLALENAKLNAKKFRLSNVEFLPPGDLFEPAKVNRTLM